MWMQTTFECLHLKKLRGQAPNPGLQRGMRRGAPVFITMTPRGSQIICNPCSSAATDTSRISQNARMAASNWRLSADCARRFGHAAPQIESYPCALAWRSGWHRLLLLIVASPARAEHQGSSRCQLEAIFARCRGESWWVASPSCVNWRFVRASRARRSLNNALHFNVLRCRGDSSWCLGVAPHGAWGHALVHCPPPRRQY